MLAFFSIDLFHLPDMLFQSAAFDEFRQRVLGQSFSVDIRYFSAPDRGNELIRKNHITQPNGRSEDFAEGPQIDDPVPGFSSHKVMKPAGLQSRFAVIVILQQISILAMAY